MKNHLIPILITTFAYTSHAQAGMKADFFDGSNFDRYVGTQTVSKIDMSWNDNAPLLGIDPHNCTIKFTGYLEAPETGLYSFSMKVDDGVKVWLNDQMIINQWDLNDNGDFVANVSLEAGKKYPLRVDYFNALVEGEIRLMWVVPSQQSKLGSYFNKPKTVGNQYFTTQKEAPGPALKNSTPAATPTKATNTPKKNPVKASPKPASKPDFAAIPTAAIASDTIAKYTPKNVLFVQSKTTMQEESKPALDQLATFLNRYTSVRMTIEGHTDIIGEQKVNQKLSEERAQVVADYLVNKGVDGSRLTTIGYGSSKPLYSDDLKKGDIKNRRVVFIMQ
jgi:outer membrane protein OmpA-like peptidoglycan-associated protein